MKNILLIIDPQNDFISGSLAVAGADEKMLKLSKYIKDKGDEYCAIYITLESHPEDHCSFKENGGECPKHCVNLTEGWGINSILEEVLETYNHVEYFNKGEDSNEEEYSIFSNDYDGEMLASLINKTCENDEDTFIDVCGIAGDYCVLETIKGLTELVNNDHIYILEEFTASTDGGKKLLEYAENNDINVIYNSKNNLNQFNN